MDSSQDARAVVHSKYGRRGAYHWSALSRNPFVRDSFTAARYEIALDLAGNVAGRSVLDFGCGDGAFLFLAYRHGAICFGYEPDAKGRALAREEFAERSLAIPVAGSLDEFGSTSFDVVFLLEVIEHVEDPAALLKTIRDLLAPGGVLVLTTPARMTERPLDPEHVREFYPDELVDLVSTVFDVERRVEAFPLAAVEVYQWAPRVVFRLPLVRWLFNLIAIATGRNPIHGIGTFRRHFVQLALRARKRANGPEIV